VFAWFPEGEFADWGEMDTEIFNEEAIIVEVDSLTDIYTGNFSVLGDVWFCPPWYRDDTPEGIVINRLDRFSMENADVDVNIFVYGEMSEDYLFKYKSGYYAFSLSDWNNDALQISFKSDPKYYGSDFHVLRDSYYTNNPYFTIDKKQPKAVYLTYSFYCHTLERGFDYIFKVVERPKIPKRGNVLFTDIVATINGQPIPSYNVSGYTMIVAEDLNAYGFDVTWDGVARALRVGAFSASKPVVPKRVESVNRLLVGAVKCAYWLTDIRTYVNGAEIYGYNIDGRTIIQFDHLKAYGTVKWDPVARVISLVTK
jgi:hypothetical protein